MANTPQDPAAKVKRAFGRSLADFYDYKHGDDVFLHPAERALLEACSKGNMAKIAVGRPACETADNIIRAGFLRFLILGGDDANPVHEQGVQVQGAWIEGSLDLNACKVEHLALCRDCTFPDALNMEDTSLRALSLESCDIRGLIGDRLKCTSSIFLRGSIEEGQPENPFVARGQVRLPGAIIGGDLDCSGGSFLGEEVHYAAPYNTGEALNCDGMSVAGRVLLREGFLAEGGVSFVGAAIGGDLDCSEGKFLSENFPALVCDGVSVKGSVVLRDGVYGRGPASTSPNSVYDSSWVALLGAQIGGSLDCSGGRFLGEGAYSLNCQGMSVKGPAYFRFDTQFKDQISFAAAKVGSLVDDPACWPGKGNLILDGFTYDRFDGEAATTAKLRDEWLMRQRPAHLTCEDFRPQPWKQTIKVLREMGHEEEARKLAIRFEEQRRTARLFKGVAGVLHDAYGGLAGYGYRPLKLLMAFLTVWFTCMLFYQNASDMGVMAPANPRIYEASEYQHCRPRAGSDVHWNHSNCSSPHEYTTFSPLLYSLDLILPLVDLQQDKDWSPMVTRAATSDPAGASETFHFGHVVRVIVWFEILFGWIVSLLFVAILSGLVKKAGDE